MTTRPSPPAWTSAGRRARARPAAPPVGPVAAPTAAPVTRATDAPPVRPLSRSLTIVMAAACGLAVANVYYAQPLLNPIAATFAISPAAIGVVVTVTQIGYGLGLFLVTPLGDLVNRRRLIAVQQTLTVVALLAAATARSAMALLAALAAIGLLAVSTQVLVAYAATLAAPQQRGRAVGAVTSGVVVGIVLSRTLAGLIAQLVGWRWVYVTAAALTAAVAAVLVRMLPRHDPHPAALNYPRLLRSMVALYRTRPDLRHRGALALLVFAAFTILWSCLALPLADPPRSLPTAVIGSFGLVGAVGAIAAARAGRLADRGHARVTTLTATALLTACWAPIALTTQPSTALALTALAVGLVALDLSVQAVHVTNQTILYATDPDARSRLAGTYMIFYSVGSAAGSIASTATYSWAGWSGVCLLGAATSLLALLVAATAGHGHGGLSGQPVVARQHRDSGSV